MKTQINKATKFIVGMIATSMLLSACGKSGGGDSNTNPGNYSVTANWAASNCTNCNTIGSGAFLARVEGSSNLGVFDMDLVGDANTINATIQRDTQLWGAQTAQSKLPLEYTGAFGVGGGAIGNGYSGSISQINVTTSGICGIPAGVYSLHTLTLGTWGNNGFGTYGGVISGMNGGTISGMRVQAVNSAGAQAFVLNFTGGLIYNPSGTTTNSLNRLNATFSIEGCGQSFLSN